MIKANYYVLSVPDADLTARFFEKALGFVRMKEGFGFCFVQRDNCVIILESSATTSPSKLGPHSYFGYLVVKDVDKEFRRILESGMSSVEAPQDKQWGMRQFAVTTPDGHRFMVGQEIGGQH